MKLIICCLCEGDEPFTCPLKFMRSYMALHFERAHQHVLAEVSLVRQDRPDERQVASWKSESGNMSGKVLLEIDLGLPVGARSPDSMDQLPGQTTRQTNWTAAAIQDLYHQRRSRSSV